LNVDRCAGSGAPGARWEPAPEGALDGQQHTCQTAGWDDSLAALRAALSAHAPVDGLLGFSQGAAVAAVLCAMQQAARGAAPGAALGAALTADGGPPSNRSAAGEDFCLHFAVLLSGFPSPCPLHARLMAEAGPLQLPSLHVFGGSAAAEGAGGDAGTGCRRGGIPVAASEALAAAFDPGAGRRLARHGGGHDVPRTKALVAAVRDFVAAQSASGE
jgi:hypothetical protein